MDGSIEKIQFLINDELHHEDFEKPYEYNWDNNVEIGTYEISAIAVDNENGKTKSNSRTVYMKKLKVVLLQEMKLNKVNLVLAIKPFLKQLEIMLRLLLNS